MKAILSVNMIVITYFIHNAVAIALELVALIAMRDPMPALDSGIGAGVGHAIRRSVEKPEPSR
jgi:hypothetical protein